MEKAGYVDLGNPPALNFGTGDWTVTAWFKTAMTGTGDANKGTIYAKGGDSTGGKRYCPDHESEHRRRCHPGRAMMM